MMIVAWPDILDQYEYNHSIYIGIQDMSYSLNLTNGRKSENLGEGVKCNHIVDQYDRYNNNTLTGALVHCFALITGILIPIFVSLCYIVAFLHHNPSTAFPVSISYIYFHFYVSLICVVVGVFIVNIRHFTAWFCLFLTLPVSLLFILTWMFCAFLPILSHFTGLLQDQEKPGKFGRVLTIIA